MPTNSCCPVCGAPHSTRSDHAGCQYCMLEAGLRTREDDIRAELLRVASDAERLEYVQQVCSDDPSLRRRVMAWLTARSDELGLVSRAPAAPLGPSLQLIGGQYWPVREIGEGGFGVVYLAEQTKPVRRNVALKILKPGMDTRQVVARFELERQALALMDHAGIAKVYDAGMTETGRPFFVMELVLGTPITEFCRANRIPIPQRLELFVLVCHAVQHAHQKGIIHRDLKPSNVLLAAGDGKPVPKVIDFGIAKALAGALTADPFLTQEHQLLGTPAYISPEQAALAGADIDTRSDIYSLGVLLYELLTGVTPFDAGELMRSGVESMRRTILLEEPIRPSLRLVQVRPRRSSTGLGSSEYRESSPRIERDLDWIVMKCLQKDRAARYPTANELAMDIQRYLAHEPIVARPPGAIYRTSLLVRRNPVVAGLAALLVLALAIGILAGAIMSAGLMRAKNETDQANRRLSKTLRYLESEKMERLAAEGRHGHPLAWLARQLRDDPLDISAAARALSMLEESSFALPIAVPLVHDGPVNSARYSVDGAEILTASDDGTVRFWDTETGKPRGTITNLTGNLGAWYAANGTRVVVLARDAILRVHDASDHSLRFEVSRVKRQSFAVVEMGAESWLYLARQEPVLARRDLRTGLERGPSLALGSLVKMMTASDAGSLVAVATEDGMVHLISVATGRPHRPPRDFGAPAANLRFTPDGGRLLISLADGERLSVWDIRNGDAISEITPPASTRMKVLQFSPDGRRLVTSFWATQPLVWDAESLRMLNRLAGAVSQGWAEYRVSPDNRHVAGITQDGIARLWDLETGERVIEPFEHQGWIRTLDFSSDGGRVLTASQDGTAKQWDVRMRRHSGQALPASAGGPVAGFDHRGTRVVVSVDPDAVQICSARTRKPLGPLLRHPGGSGRAHVRQATFSHDDSKLVTAGDDGLLRVWDTRSFEVIFEHRFRHEVRFARFSPDGSYLVAGDRPGEIAVWSSGGGGRVGSVKAHDGGLTALNMHPHGESFVTASPDGTARCWSLPGCAPVGPPLRHRGIVWSADYSPDGNEIVTASAENAALVWNPRTGRRNSKPLPHDKDVFSACFSLDGTRILTASEDHTARVWNARSGEAVAPPLRHEANVWMAVFSPDGRWVATGSDDGVVRIWDAESGLPVSGPLVHTNQVVRLAFSPNGRQILSNGGQSKLRDLFVPTEPAPEWFCRLVEAIAGYGVQPEGGFRAIPPDRLRPLLPDPLADTGGNGFYVRWARWLLVDRLGEPSPATPAM